VIYVDGHELMSRSCAQLSYGDVQNVISGNKLDASISDDHSVSEVEGDIMNLRVCFQDVTPLKRRS
jgi:hypothetical protein